jgi:hypothetical protein
MPIFAPEGYLDITNATLRGSEIITTSNVGIMNANPTRALSVGSNLHVNAYSSNVVQVNGNVVAQGLKIGFIEVLPSYDLSAVSNVGNVTLTTIQFSNATTAFVADSNIEVGTANLFVDTQTGRVGVGTTEPSATLDVEGDAIISGNLTVSGTTTVVNTENLSIKDPIIELGRDNVSSPEVDVGLIMTRPSGVANVAMIYDESADSLEIGHTLNGAQDAVITMDTASTLPVNIHGSLDIVGNLNLQKVSNTATIQLNSNVVTEYMRSKKLIKYPRVYMSAATTSGYTASANSEYTGRVAWEQFDSNPLGSSWETANNSFDSSGASVGGDTFTANGGSYTGHWAKLQLPERVVLYEMTINCYKHDTLADDRRPKKGVVLGSNDDSTWELIHRFDNDISWSDLYTNIDSAKIAFSHTQNAYEYILFLVEEKYGTTTRLAIFNMEYFGVPEYDPEAHGTDVIMRSVPNVPNTDWLEVYYDAKGLSNGSISTVDDLTPGGSNDGTATNLNVSDEAFVFNGTNSHLAKNSMSIPGGNNPFTFSFWVKSTKTSGNHYIFRLGDTNIVYQTVGMYINPSYQFVFASWTLDFPLNHTFQESRWYHVSLVYTSEGWSQSSLTAYVDGQYTSFGTNISSGGVGGSNLAMATSVNFMIGSFNNASDYLNGSIANFRLFNRALSADEAWQLYAYQKEYFDVSPDVVTFKGGRLGIGTSEPRAQLDVRGGAVIDGIVGTSPTGAIIIPSGTAAQQPTGQAGMIRFNTSSSALEIYNGTVWATVGGVSATGGTVTTADGYTIHTFTSSENFVVLSGGVVEYLIVAGGGGGGTRHQGGGGAGGMLTGTVTSLTPGTYTITVGPGGAGRLGSSGAGNGTTGTDTTAIGFTAKGGGGSNQTGGSSGGGPATNGGTSTSPNPYDLISGDQGSQGYRGGSGYGSASAESTYNDGGGGGAGGVGGSATSTTPGDGGVGLQSSISGTSTYYAGGGGGGGGDGGTDEGTGGSGGGGRGGRARAAEDGTDGLGGGGGSGGFDGATNYNGGSGGDGIVIIRYLT